MRWRACGGPVRNGVRDGTAMAQRGLRRAVAGSGGLRSATALTCADSAGCGSPTGVFAGVRGLLMRFGFAPIRGSNPRASAADQPLRRAGEVPAVVSVIINTSCWANAGPCLRGGGQMLQIRRLGVRVPPSAPASQRSRRSGPCRSSERDPEFLSGGLSSHYFSHALNDLVDGQCDRYARVTIEGAQGQRARACPRHAVAALNGLARARVVWDDTRGINQHETAGLQLAEERSELARCAQLNAAICEQGSGSVHPMPILLRTKRARPQFPEAASKTGQDSSWLILRLEQRRPGCLPSP